MQKFVTSTNFKIIICPIAINELHLMAYPCTPSGEAFVARATKYFSSLILNQLFLSH